MREAHRDTWCSGLLGYGTDREAKVKEVSQCVHLLGVCISTKRQPRPRVSWTALLVKTPRNNPLHPFLHFWYLLVLA